MCYYWLLQQTNEIDNPSESKLIITTGRVTYFVREKRNQVVFFKSLGNDVRLVEKLFQIVIKFLETYFLTRPL